MKRELLNELILEGARQRLLDLEKQRLEIYKAFPQLTPIQVETKLRKSRPRVDPKLRHRVLTYAAKHGIPAAAEKYEVNQKTAYNWKRRSEV